MKLASRIATVLIAACATLPAAAVSAQGTPVTAPSGQARSIGAGVQSQPLDAPEINPNLLTGVVVLLVGGVLVLTARMRRQGRTN